MKSKLKFIGMVAMVALIGFSMTGCPSTSNSGGGFVDITGTWRGNCRYNRYLAWEYCRNECHDNSNRYKLDNDNSWIPSRSRSSH